MMKMGLFLLLLSFDCHSAYINILDDLIGNSRKPAREQHQIPKDLITIKYEHGCLLIENENKLKGYGCEVINLGED